jgi:hypothetical protein
MRAATSSVRSEIFVETKTKNNLKPRSGHPHVQPPHPPNSTLSLRAIRPKMHPSDHRYVNIKN